jgi:hypothetical protein
MNKLKLSLAAAIAALAFFSCGDVSDTLAEAVGAIKPTPPSGTTETSITITFKNGWENVVTEDLKDDDYTKFKYYLPLSPITAYAVVDTAAKEAYDEAYSVWKEINDEYILYAKELEKAQENGESPPPPPRKNSLKNLFLL